MVLIGKCDLLFDVTYFFGSNPSNTYFYQEKDFETAQSMVKLCRQVAEHRGDILIVTHLEKTVEEALSDEGFLVNKDYFFFPALKSAFGQLLARQGCSAEEATELWPIYCRMFYSSHGKYMPCQHPLYEAEITAGGNVHTCCSAIMPFAIGNVRHTPIRKIWHSPRARLLRLSPLNGTAIFCTPEKCGLLRAGSTALEKNLPQVSDYPLVINIAVDATCNLSCPSCRTGVLVEDQDALGQKLRWLEGLDEAFYRDVADIYVAGNGECMFSRVYRSYLLDQLIPKFRGRLHLVTNGQIWNDELLGKITAVFQPEVLISIDAWEKETYEKLRRGGSYSQLLENVKKYVTLQAQGKLSAVVARFVVQVCNYQEIPRFIRNMRKLGIDRIELTRLVDGGAFSVDGFESNSLLNKDGSLKKEYLPFFAQHVWPLLGNDVSADCAYLPQ